MHISVKLFCKQIRFEKEIDNTAFFSFVSLIVFHDEIQSIVIVIAIIFDFYYYYCTCTTCF